MVLYLSQLKSVTVHDVESPSFLTSVSCTSTTHINYLLCFRALQCFMITNVLYRFLNGSKIRCLSKPNRANDRRPWREKKNNTSVQLTDDPYQYPNGSWGIWKTNLSIVGHSTEELQLQVELTGHAVKEQPQAAGQVLSRQKTKAITKKKKKCLQ